MFKVRIIISSAVALFFATTQVVAATTSSVVVPGKETQVTASIDAVAPAKSPVSLSYVAESSAKMADANKSLNGSFKSTQHVGLGYTLDADRSVQYRQYFSYNSTDDSKKDEWSLGYHMFRYKDAKLFATEALPIATEFRFFIAGSDYERDIGTLILRNDSSVTYKVGKLDIDYGLSTRVATYTQEQAGQTALRLLPSVYATYKATEKVSPFVGAYTDHKWNHTGTPIAKPGATKAATDTADNQDSLNIGLGIKAALTKNVSLNPYVETATDFRKSYSAQNNGLFDQDNMTYLLDLIVSM